MCSRYYRCYITIDISMVDCYNNIVEVYKQGRSYKDYDKDIIHSVDSVFFVEINQIEIRDVQRWAPFDFWTFSSDG